MSTSILFGQNYKKLDRLLHFLFVISLLVFIQPAHAADALKANQQLNVGKALQSPDGRAKLRLQQNGNLILTYDNKQLWASKTAGSGSNALQMRQDGNLVLLNAAKKIKWSAQTGGNSGSKAQILDDGNFIITKPNGDQVWETNTCCHPKGNNNPGNNNVNGMGQWSNVINWPNIAL
ncbi:MAG: bulb-type lectin domain-containing protein, partial [Gammaproteobacteria bacterium]